MEKSQKHNDKQKTSHRRCIHYDSCYINFKDMLKPCSNHTILFRNTYISSKSIKVCIQMIHKKFRVVLVATSGEQVRL